MKITSADVAKMAIMRAVGYRNSEIAQHLGISESTVAYYMRKLRQRASKVNPEIAFAELMLASMPTYPLPGILKKLFGLGGKQR